MQRNRFPLFAAHTVSIQHEKIVLLHSKDSKRRVIVPADVSIRLSRSVASTVDEELKVSVRAWVASGGGSSWAVDDKLAVLWHGRLGGV